jgi:hypothetical protein
MTTEELAVALLNEVVCDIEGGRLLRQAAARLRSQAKCIEAADKMRGRIDFEDGGNYVLHANLRDVVKKYDAARNPKEGAK